MAACLRSGLIVLLLDCAGLVFNLVFSTPATAQPTVSIAADDDEIKEGSKAVFTLKRDTTTSTLKVNVSVSASVAEDDVPVDAPAVTFGTFPGEVTFTAGQETTRVEISTGNDRVWQAHTTVRTTIQPGTNYDVSRSTSHATVLVRDDDIAVNIDIFFPEGRPRLSYTTSSVTVREDGSGVVPVGYAARTRDGRRPHADFRVSLNSESASARSGQDYRPLSVMPLVEQSFFRRVPLDGGDYVWEARLSEDLFILNDKLAESTERFSIRVERAPSVYGRSFRIITGLALFTIDIVSEDHAPVITKAGPFVAFADFMFLSTTSVFAVLGATDADGDTPTWAITSGADMDKFDLEEDTGELSFSGSYGFTDDADGDGTYDLVVTVTDGYNPVSTPVTVTLAPGNAPVMYAKGGVEEPVDLGLETALRGSFAAIDSGATVSDAEGDGVAAIFYELALTNAAGERSGVNDALFARCRVSVGSPRGISLETSHALSYSDVVNVLKRGDDLAGVLPIPLNRGLLLRQLGEELNPSDLGAGLVYVTEVGGGVIPISLVPAIVRGVKAGLGGLPGDAHGCGDVDRDVGEQATIRFTIVPYPGTNPIIARQEYRLRITPVNDPPEATAPLSPGEFVFDVPERATTRTFGVTLFTAADAVESGQSLRTSWVSTVSADYPANVMDVNELITVVNPVAGTFSFSVAPNRYGELGFSVRLSDDGGTVNGGDDSTDFGPYRIRVAPVDSPPRFELVSDEVRVVEGASRFTFGIRNADNGVGDPGIADFPGDSPAAVTVDLVGGNTTDVPLGLKPSVVGLVSDTGGIAVDFVPGQDDAHGRWTLRVTLVENDNEPTVSDDNGNGEITRANQSTSTELVLVIEPVNDTPVLSVKGGAPGLLPGEEAVPLRLNISDPDVEARRAGRSAAVLSAAAFPPYGGYAVGSTLRFGLAAGTTGTSAAAIDIDLVGGLSNENDVLTIGDVVITRGAGKTLRFARGNTGAGEMKFSRHPAPGVSPGAPRRQVFEAKVSAYLSAPALTAFLDGAVGASIDDGGPGAKEDRRIEVSFRDAGNDGIDGVTGPPAVSNVVSLRIFPDLSPLKGPVEESRRVMVAETGATEAVLAWKPARDRLLEEGDYRLTRAGRWTRLPHGGLRHAIGITDVTGITGDDRCGMGKHVAEIFAEEAEFAADDLYDDTSGYAVLDTVTGDTGASTRTSNGYVNDADGVRAVFRVTRRDATLIPGREYCFELSASDLAGNEELVYEPVVGEMQLDFGEGHLAEVRGELAAIVNDDVAGYCGSEFGDADGDGVPNNVEVLIGLECRKEEPGRGIIPGSEVTYVGARPLDIGFTPGPGLRMTAGGVVVYPGSGPLTEVSGLGAECRRGTGVCTLTPYRSRDVRNAACSDRTGQGGVLRADDPGAGNCEAADGDGDGDPELGSFSRLVLWVARDGYYNWASTEQKVYVQPPVGFDVSSLPVEGASASVPVSLSLSDDVIGSTVKFTVDLDISGEGVSASTSLDQANRFRLVELSLPDATMPYLVAELTIEGAELTVDDGAVPVELAQPRGLPPGELFTLGNDVLELKPGSGDPPALKAESFVLYVSDVVEPRPYLVTLGDASTNSLSFELFTSPPSRYEVSAEVLAGPSLAYSTAAVMTASSRAGSGERVALLTPGLREGDLVKIAASTGGEIFAGFFVSVVSQEDLAVLDDNAPVDVKPGARLKSIAVSGVRGDPVRFRVPGLSRWSGGYALAASTLSVLLPGTADHVPAVVTRGPPRYAGTGIFDFTVAGLEIGSVASILIEMDGPASGGQMLHKCDDGTWSPFTTGDTAPFDRYYSAPFPCPGLNARRGDDSDAGEWRLASVGGVRAGYGCILVEIQDGSVNDTGGVKDGVIHDPGALAGVGERRHGGGGGALGPAWLFPLALGAVASAARRANGRRSTLTVPPPADSRR